MTDFQDPGVGGRTTPESSNHWGILMPANPNNPNICQIELLKSKAKYTVGRHQDCDIKLSKCPFISIRHCTIEWEGVHATSSPLVILTDTSTNGTYIDHVRVGSAGKPASKLMSDGCEVVFGTCVAKKSDCADQDFRFIFRYTASQPTTHKLGPLYTPYGILGCGSFGTVWKAFHQAEQEYYAVKKIRWEKISDNFADVDTAAFSTNTPPSRLRREIDIMQKLDHKNICRFKEAFHANQSLCIVMEYIRGGDLLHYIRKSKSGLSEPLTQNFTFQICDALAYIHDLDIAHRDLKPENILLTDHNPPIVKIADFGLAKLTDTDTMLRTCCGTPSYLAPEVSSGSDKGYDFVVDSWSVGVIVFEMKTKQVPFRSQDDMLVPRDQRYVDWGVLERTSASQLCKEFVAELLQSNPAERMTLTSALFHPWLAEQALQRGSISEIEVSDQFASGLAERSSVKNGGTTTGDARERTAFQWRKRLGIEY